MAADPEVARLSAVQRWIVFPIGRLICRLVMTLFGRARVRGAYRVPREGGVLVLANHRADVDPMLVQIACPRDLRFMAKSDLFDLPVIGAVLRLVGSFPVKRGEPDRGAIRRAAELVKLGEAVCIFPEGQLTETGQLQAIKAGVALVVRMADSPVICVGLKHTDAIMPYGSVIPRFTWKQVSAMWGEPRSFGKDTPADEILAWIDGQLKELSDEEEER